MMTQVTKKRALDYPEHALIDQLCDAVLSKLTAQNHSSGSLRFTLPTAR